MMSKSEPAPGPASLEWFTEAMRHIMAVPKYEVEKRPKEYRKERHAQRKPQKKARS